MGALLFDFGGVFLLTPFELLRQGEQAMGLAAGTLPWTGPFDPDADPLWQRWERGEITERQYWAMRASEVGALIDRPGFDTVDLMGVLYATPHPGELVRPEGLELVKRARADGRVVALLTNDLHAFHDDEWVSRMTILEQFDPLIDLSRGSVLKPDPRAFRSAIDRLGLPAQEVLFIDDLRSNIAGADDVGLATQWFDVTRPRESFATVAARVGLLD